MRQEIDEKVCLVVYDIGNCHGEMRKGEIQHTTLRMDGVMRSGSVRHTALIINYNTSQFYKMILCSIHTNLQEHPRFSLKTKKSILFLHYSLVSILIQSYHSSHSTRTSSFLRFPVIQEQQVFIPLHPSFYPHQNHSSHFDRNSPCICQETQSLTDIFLFFTISQLFSPSHDRSFAIPLVSKHICSFSSE